MLCYNMKPTKQQKQSNISGKNKRQKLIFDSNSSLTNSFTHLEDLSNELFYEIFDFLDFCHVYTAFSNLNTRFENLLNDPILPIRISVSSISKSTFQCYYKQIIIPYQHRITLLHLSNPLIIDRIFSPISILLEFIRLENLSLCNIESKYFKEILNYLVSLPCLSSLAIHCTNEIQDKNIFYQQIFRLPALKYCKLSLEGNAKSSALPIATTEFSSIEYFIIIGNLYTDELNTFLSYMPKIRRLSIRNLCESSKKHIEFHPVVLNQLTHVSLTITQLNFDEFESIMKILFHQIQVLDISKKNNLVYIDANRWEKLIVSHLPNLRLFDFQYKHYFNKINHLFHDDLFNKFNSSFWFQRKWFFEHHIYYDRDKDYVIFYSINPYRRKKYILCEEKNENINQNYINSVNHLEIRTKKSVINCKNYFSNVTKITLIHDFIHSFSIQLNKIIPLNQLTKLIINSNLSCFSKMIELLRYTPNIHTLNIDLLSFHDTQRVYQLTNLYVLQQSENFRSVSKTNNIENLKIMSSYTMEVIPFFINLCPRLQHLTTNRSNCNSQQLLQLLLSKTNDITRHLASLCIENVFENEISWVREFLKSQKEFTIDSMRLEGLPYNNMYTYYNIYLWW